MTVADEDGHALLNRNLKPGTLDSPHLEGVTKVAAQGVPLAHQLL
jgi:hypothetical protein